MLAHQIPVGHVVMTYFKRPSSLRRRVGEGNRDALKERWMTKEAGRDGEAERGEKEKTSDSRLEERNETGVSCLCCS